VRGALPWKHAYDEEDLERDLVALGDDRPNVREHARERLEGLGEKAAPVLLRELEDDRLGGAGLAEILRLLGRLALPETLPAVLAMLNDRRWIVRSAAMMSAAAFAGEEPTQALIDLLDERDLDVVNYATVLLGGRGDQEAVAPVAELLRSPDAGVRYSAVRALTELSGPAAWAALDRHVERESSPKIAALIASARPRDE
jgi:HEAT repeat protein